MAAPPLLTLTDITLGFGGDPLFTGLSLTVAAGERTCLVGRNGSGKSTLLKVMAGQIAPDGGEVFVRPGAKVAYLPQDPDLSGFATLGAYVAADLDEGEGYVAAMAMEGLQVAAGADPATASGGERRRAALARLIAAAPDLMLLDEPTNHLDIAAIQWLEAYLSDSRAGFILISHDRAFLRRLSQSTLWLDRGAARRLPKGFDAFEDWRDKTYEEEAAQRHKLNRLIKAESRWAVEGISARRKRNMGRVRRLRDLRAERAGQRARTGTAAMALDAGPKSGRLVAEAEGISKSYGDKLLLKDFSIRIMRGERVALVGPNGVGKTTLLKILTGEETPDGGRIRLGVNLVPAVFDQNRAALDPAKSLWDTLAGDKELGVKGRNDQIMVRGAPKHVVGYLKEFLFDDAQARGPVRALSGGERARLLLAKIMARESNLLILDEPTNDLDMETLDLLQELLGDFDGTVLLVSHDRDFIDRVATTTVVMEGEGRATICAGGWSDAEAQMRPAEAPAIRAASKTPKAEAPQARAATKQSYARTRRLAELPEAMSKLEAEIAKLADFLADPDLYIRAPRKFAQATKALSDRQATLAAAEQEWLELEAEREAFES